MRNDRNPVAVMVVDLVNEAMPEVKRWAGAELYRNCKKSGLGVKSGLLTKIIQPSAVWKIPAFYGVLLANQMRLLPSDTRNNIFAVHYYRNCN
jgi:hypothetical protein